MDELTVSDKTQSLNEILGEDGVQNTFSNFMSLWILPEIESRKQSGKLTDSFILNKAQVIFDPDKQEKIVRLNDEVQALAKAKLKAGTTKVYNEPIYENEIEGIISISLTDQDSPDAGHVTFLRFKNTWIMHMDFRQHKGKAKVRYESALQFLRAAKLNFENKLERPFIDNLFSAVELLATSQLLCISESQYVKKQSHPSTNMKYNSYVKIGNAKPEFANVLNKLWSLTNPARYCNSQLTFDWKDGEKYLQTAEEMVAHTRTLIS